MHGSCCTAHEEGCTAHAARLMRGRARLMMGCPPPKEIRPFTSTSSSPHQSGCKSGCTCGRLPFTSPPAAYASSLSPAGQGVAVRAHINSSLQPATLLVTALPCTPRSTHRQHAHVFQRRLRQRQGRGATCRGAGGCQAQLPGHGQAADETGGKVEGGLVGWLVGGLVGGWVGGWEEEGGTRQPMDASTA